MMMPSTRPLAASAVVSLAVVTAALATLLALAGGATAVDVHDEGISLTVDNTTAGAETLITFRSYGAFGTADHGEFCQNSVEAITLKLCRGLYSVDELGRQVQECYRGEGFRNRSYQMWLGEDAFTCLTGVATGGNAECWTRTRWPENATSGGAYTLTATVKLFRGVDFPVTYLSDSRSVRLEQPVATASAAAAGSAGTGGGPGEGSLATLVVGVLGLAGAAATRGRTS